MSSRTVIRQWFRSRSVFSMLLITTIVCTCLMVIVAVATLQRVADEHPRRYLSRALFHHTADLNVDPTTDIHTIEGVEIIVFTISEAERSEYAALLEAARGDSDGIAIRSLHDHYIAGMVRDDAFVVLPEFGEEISAKALILLAILLTVTVGTIVGIYFLMRYLTSPFSVISHGVAKVESGDFTHQIPTERTYGEFHALALSFNKMVEQVRRTHEARRQMLLAIPHELFTPLARLKVRKDLIKDEELRTKIARDIVVLEEILNAILATERKEAGSVEVEQINVEAFVNEAILPFIESGATFEVKIDPETETIMTQRFVLSVLLKNFVSNAVRYGREKPIEVRARALGEHGEVAISVKDRGIGVAEHEIPYMTEPFWRADKARHRESGGFGLGLYLCQTIVEGFGGRLEIESELDVGTTVTAVVPHAIIEKKGLG